MKDESAAVGAVAFTSSFRLPTSSLPLHPLSVAAGGGAAVAARGRRWRWRNARAALTLLEDGDADQPADGREDDQQHHRDDPPHDRPGNGGAGFHLHAEGLSL